MTLYWSEAIIAIMALGLLAVSAISDVTNRTIPNWACLGILLLFIPFAFFSHGSVNLVSNLISFAGVFSVTFLLWRFGMLGGGDVKLLSAVAIWTSVQMLGPFLVMVTLTGGILAIAYLMLFNWIPYLIPFAGVLATAVSPPPEPANEPGPGRDEGDGSPPAKPRLTVPYGVAIAVGGVWVVLQHVPLIG